MDDCSRPIWQDLHNGQQELSMETDCFGSHQPNLGPKQCAQHTLAGRRLGAGLRIAGTRSAGNRSTDDWRRWRNPAWILPLGGWRHPFDHWCAHGCSPFRRGPCRVSAGCTVRGSFPESHPATLMAAATSGDGPKVVTRTSRYPKLDARPGDCAAVCGLRPCSPDRKPIQQAISAGRPAGAERRLATGPQVLT